MKTRMRWIYSGTLLAAVLLAVVLIVTLWNPGSARLPADAILVPRDVPTLQAALNEASPGDTIAVQASAGPIQGPWVLRTPDVTLTSSGGRAHLRGIGGDPALSVEADGIILRGLDVTSESIGIRVSGADCRVEDVVVTDAPIGIQLDAAARCALQMVEIHGGSIGLDVMDSGSIHIEMSSISDASECGVRLRGAWNASVNDVELTDDGLGIAIEQGSTNNTLSSSKITRCDIAGIEVRGSNDNAIVDIDIDSTRVGIVLEGVTGIEIRGCRIENSALSGILLQQAVQNRVVETRITGSQEVGMRLSQSAENAILYNEILRCGDAGIHLMTSSRNLILGNEINDCPTGIRAAGSDAMRILRNHITGADVSGILLSGGGASRVLDNTLIGGGFGIVLTGTKADTLLRNDLRTTQKAGISLIESRGNNDASENAVQDAAWGVLVVGSFEDRVTHNHLVKNDVGMLLAQIGNGVRIEGNTLEENRVGLRQLADATSLADELASLDSVLSLAAGDEVPILTNNVFVKNSEIDVQNDSMTPLFAAGNWWGEAGGRDTSLAVVSDGVSLEESAWKGTIAVGSEGNDVSVLLGRILQQTLAREGFHVIGLVGMRPSDRVRQALLDADVDLVWWEQRAADSNNPLGDGAETSTIPTQIIDGWSVVISAQMADRLSEKTVSGLAQWVDEIGEPLRYTAVSSLEEAAFDRFLESYGLDTSVRSFTQSESLSEVEALLKFGAVDVAIVRSLEETLTLSGFISLTDDQAVLDREEISMVIQSAVVMAHPEIESILRSLAQELTGDVLHDLVSRVRLLGMDPKDVAQAFLAP